MIQIKSTDVSNFFSNIHLDDGGNDYVSYHSKRFAEIINLIEQYKQGEDVEILDIGPAFQTMLIKEYNKQAHVDTLGYEFGLIEYKEVVHNAHLEIMY